MFFEALCNVRYAFVASSFNRYRPLVIFPVNRRFIYIDITFFGPRVWRLVMFPEKVRKITGKEAEKSIEKHIS
jgi:hypothetical protein